jgi:hypothetical protein
LVPTVYIAQVYEYDIQKLAVRQSFSRAARRLENEGLLAIWYLTVPTAEGGMGLTSRRAVQCVCRRDVEMTDRLRDVACLFAARVYTPQFAEVLGRALRG